MMLNIGLESLFVVQLGDLAVLVVAGNAEVAIVNTREFLREEWAAFVRDFPDSIEFVETEPLRGVTRLNDMKFPPHLDAVYLTPYQQMHPFETKAEEEARQQRRQAAVPKAKKRRRKVARKAAPQRPRRSAASIAKFKATMAKKKADQIAADIIKGGLERQHEELG